MLIEEHDKRRASWSDILAIIALIFGGCCTNVIALERLVADAPKSGNLFTLAQFLFITGEGFLYNLDFSSSVPQLKKRGVPLYRWFLQVVMFFTVSVLNNIAFGYRISVPLHIIFRSGGLIVSMILGWTIRKRRYSIEQVIAVVMVTIGVILATISSSDVGMEGDATVGTPEYVTGISLLSITLVLSCFMGLYQEFTYEKYQSDWREGLFYTHFLALPLFLLFYSDIKDQIQVYNESMLTPLSKILPIPDGFQNISTCCTFPRTWVYLFINVLTQYVCISGVHKLQSVVTALTLNLVLNIRKFTSLVISIWLFNNKLHSGIVIGGLLVFVGTLLYSIGANKPKEPKINEHSEKMFKDSDKDIWNARTIERLAELTTSSTGRNSITSTPVKRESPNIVSKNIGKKYKASSLPASPNKINVLQRRVLEQPKVNTLNSASSNGGLLTKDRKTNNFAKKNNTVSSATLFDFFSRPTESNCSPNIRKGTLKGKLENEAINIITSKYWNLSEATTILKLENADSNSQSDSNVLCDNDNGNNIFDNDTQYKDETLGKDESTRSFVRSNSKKECPWYKKLQDTNITVDAFKYGNIPNCTAYFLSHFHSDHYIGLSSKWSHGPIYCSTVTGNLVIQQLRVKPQYVRKLPMNEEVAIDKTNTTVTLIDANHCPGSALFLFKTKFADGKIKRYLHTGDFRACPRQVLHSAIAQPDNPQIDILYLDTTYLNERYCFPAQEQVVNAIIQLIKEVIKNGELLPLKRMKKTIKEQEDKSQMVLDQWFKGKPKEELTHSDSDLNKEEEDSIEILDTNLSTTSMNIDETEQKCVSLQDSKILIVVGTYLIGKEKVFWGIAKALNSKIYVSDAKRKMIMCQENPELEALLTGNPQEASVHVMYLTKIKPEELIYYLQNLQPTFKHVMAFRPTGWAYKPSTCGAFTTSSTTDVILNSAPSYTMDLITPSYNSPTCQIFGVPYSEHSSFRELAAFIMSLNIGRIIPTVNIESEESRKEMDYWLNKWQNEKKKNKNVRIAPYSIIDYW
ncbi:19065_t:CDS:10 [Cetraspora pellucida]|uniref:19065_t:CDS:1 n=1 Tax=Cetraspora pellucida TaxID=1433469 RepID=A0A9N8WPX1_9GLOM|nr:19065_t:CDS:10 [Cetraspora pellucida]